MLNVIMLNVIMLNVIMLNVIKLRVIMLNVIAPINKHKWYDIIINTGFHTIILRRTHQQRDSNVVRRSHDPVQLQLGLLHAVGGLARVDDEDDGVRGAGVRLPQRPELFLPANVPDEEGEVARTADEPADAFAVEADGGDGVDVLPTVL